MNAVARASGLNTSMDSRNGSRLKGKLIGGKINQATRFLYGRVDVHLYGCKQQTVILETGSKDRFNLGTGSRTSEFSIGFMVADE